MKKPLAILSALEDEQRGLREQLAQLRCVRRAGRDFWCGELAGQPVVLALSRIGKVAAATTTTVLIEHFGVGQIVFTGVAGGLSAGVRVGDVVIASGFVQHDLDASPLFPRFEVPLYGRAEFGCDEALSDRLWRAAQALRADSKLGQAHRGLVVSGDRFVSSRSESDALRAGLPEALAVEMEGAAVAQACFDYGIPFAAARTISDRADDDAHTDFSQFVRAVAGPVATQLVTRMMHSTN